ncbi:sensor histidine kinase [Frigoribacterium sp. 2-23]|uniref:sensor histidine kinase n=1 Tax=Frigoribacterium sp. 2-23 TaxID=3415006 RepID=UPI003C6F6FFD
MTGEHDDGVATAGDDVVPAITVVTPGRPDERRTPAPPRAQRIVAQVVVTAVVVVIAVALAAVVAARQLAENESIADAAERADRIADALIVPALGDALTDATDTPASAAAREALDDVVRDHVRNDTIVRIKIWDATGRVLWSDEPRLVGETFDLDDDDLEALAGDGVSADVSDLTRPENVYERDRGTLLEAYRSVATPSGEPLLFEVYFRYDEVVARAGDLWRGFAGVTIGSIVLLVLLLTPVLWRLLTALAAARQTRERLLQRALDASDDERRRIAATLHDGVVQDLVGVSYGLAGEAAAFRGRGDTAGADAFDASAGSVRRSIGGLRTLLVDIYPPRLDEAGLGAALDDLAASVRSRGIAVVLDVDPPEVLATALDDDGRRVVFRVAQECLANVVKHSRASRVRITLRRAPRDPAESTPVGRVAGHVVRLEIADDGAGFDATTVLDHPPDGHLGLRLLSDVARESGAELTVTSASGAGTIWRLTLAARP